MRYKQKKRWTVIEVLYCLIVGDFLSSKDKREIKQLDV